MAATVELAILHTDYRFIAIMAYQARLMKMISITAIAPALPSLTNSFHIVSMLDGLSSLSID
jgi:hypothetical protein